MTVMGVSLVYPGKRLAISRSGWRSFKMLNRGSSRTPSANAMGSRAATATQSTFVKDSDWELNILDQLISKRYNSSKVTLITTNYISSKESEDTEDTNQILEIRVGERISSRLYEMCKFIHLKGEDYRKKI